MSSASVFAPVGPAPPIEIFELTQKYRSDGDPRKVDLGVGAYRTNEASPWVLPVVRETEIEMAADESLNHEYLTILGIPDFSIASNKLLLGSQCKAITENRVLGIQCLSGTGSIRVGADFLNKILNRNTIYYSDPSWPNHGLVFKHAGFEQVRSYRYWDPINRSLDFEGMMQDLKSAPTGSVIVLHACAHNPTGVDPSREQWSRIASLMKSNSLFPFFDCAYQGFASGDLDADASTVRFFVDQGFELLCAQSYAKNFGLYNERAGNLVLVTSDPAVIPNVKAQLTLLVRGNYSNPPNHGARIVLKVLTNEQKYQKWTECIKIMASRIKDMRTGLRKELEAIGTPGNWNHITDQIGMFSYTGLTPQQVDHLVTKCHIYLTKSGRISICGLNTNNLTHVAASIKEAVTLFPA